MRIHPPKVDAPTKFCVAQCVQQVNNDVVISRIMPRDYLPKGTPCSISIDAIQLPISRLPARFHSSPRTTTRQKHPPDPWPPPRPSLPHLRPHRCCTMP